MLPDPLHPAVVHLPIALSVLLPLGVITAFVLIRQGTNPRTAWGVVVGLTGLLLASSWVAVKSGEAQEEVVEDVVPKQWLKQHEERAQQFMVVGGLTLALATLGLARGRLGRTGRALATVGVLALLPAAWRVGHSGGELVYTHGAAEAHVAAAGARGDVTGPEHNRSQARPEDDQ